MGEQHDHPDKKTADQLVTEAWAEGRIVVQGTFMSGPDSGHTFMVLHPRSDIEQTLKEVLDGMPDANRICASVCQAVRRTVERGISHVDEKTRDDFNEDIPLLLVFLLAFGREQVQAAGVDLQIALSANAEEDIVTRGGLDPELIARAPGAVPAQRVN